MKFADKISLDTERFEPRIKRYEDGDIIFMWPRPVSIETLAGIIGIEEDMFDFTKHYVLLEMPKEVAECSC